MSHYAVEEGTFHVHFDFQGFQAYNNINGYKVELFLINRYPPLTIDPGNTSGYVNDKLYKCMSI